MKLSWEQYILLLTVLAPALGMVGYWEDWPALVKLGLSGCLLYFGLQVTWGMLRHPSIPVLGFLAGAAWGWWMGHGALRSAADGLLIATAVEAVSEAIAMARAKGEEQEPTA